MGFGHEKLDVYRTALQYCAWAFGICSHLSGMHRHPRDQLLRSSQSIPQNIAEGNGKASDGERRRHFEIARGSALECAATQDVLVVCGALSPEKNMEGKALLDRIVAMLTRMGGRGYTVAEEAAIYETSVSDGDSDPDPDADDNAGTQTLSNSVSQSQSVSESMSPSQSTCEAGQDDSDTDSDPDPDADYDKSKAIAFPAMSRMHVLIRGGGDLASGVAWRLHQCGFRLIITEISRPLAVRRRVSFCEAVYDHETVVEGVKAVLVTDPGGVETCWEQGHIPVVVDPLCNIKEVLKPQVLVDAVLAKRNTGTSIQDAPLVIALGPGFEAGRDAHYVVETNRGHSLGRLLTRGFAEANTGVPGPIMGITGDRILRAPADGLWDNALDIGDSVGKGDLIGSVRGVRLEAPITGVIRGLIHPGSQVTMGLKIGDIDPRGTRELCFSISEKALAVAGGVLEGIMRGPRFECFWR